MIFNVQPYKIDYDFYPDKKVIFCDYENIFPREIYITEVNTRIVYIDASDCIEDKPLHEFAMLQSTFFGSANDDSNLHSVFGLPVGVDISSYSGYQRDEDGVNLSRYFYIDGVKYTVTFRNRDIISVVASDSNHLSKVNLIVGYDYFITKEFNVETEETV